MKRYQECNLFVKLYRRIKYQPIYFIYACWCFIKSVFNYPIYQYRENPFLVYKIIYSIWYEKAKWYYTHEEVFKKYK